MEGGRIQEYKDAMAGDAIIFCASRPLYPYYILFMEPLKATGSKLMEKKLAKLEHSPSDYQHCLFSTKHMIITFNFLLEKMYVKPCGVRNQSKIGVSKI